MGRTDRLKWPAAAFAAAALSAWLCLAGCFGANPAFAEGGAVHGAHDVQSLEAGTAGNGQDSPDGRASDDDEASGSADSPGSAPADEAAQPASPDSSAPGEDAEPSDPSDVHEPDVPALADVSAAQVVLPKKRFVHTGKKIEPKPQVMLQGMELVRGRDYRLAYHHNSSVGIATVTVVGLPSAGYAGSASATFTIVPRKAKVARAQSPSGAVLSVRARTVPGAKGYQFRVGEDAKLKKAAKSRTAASRACAFKGLEQGARYYVRVRAYAIIGGERVWGAWSRAKAVRVKWKPTWLESGGYYTHRQGNGKLARGLAVIDGRTYLFDGAGRQKVGWQNVKGAYRFFNIANGKGGFMATNAVVNGVAIGKDGAARVTPAGAQELSIMCKAQKLVEQLTVPAQSKRDKLARGFYYLKNDCVESLTRSFGAYGGWHRAMALDVFDRRTGSCFSYGAALAYFANAIGCGSCAAVSSGGHGWAEIDGKVYDAEWSRHCGRDLFAVSYGESGGGTPAYASSRVYVVRIAPNASRW